jgi:hypothetical protein
MADGHAPACARSLRGGTRADEQARATDVGWEALERTAPEAAPG